MARTVHITITGQEQGLPFSKGLMASSIMATGLTPRRAYDAAEAVEDRLVAEERFSVSAGDLQEVVFEVLTESVGERYAANFLKWQAAGELDRPLVILIGGATGAGKSTIASQLASRLAVSRVIPTDAIREVMRGMITRDLMPTLHASSFETEELITQPLPHSADKVVIGFREQAQAVCVGVNSLIHRAVTEGTDLIIEGAHACPGFFEPPLPDEAVFVPMVITVEDEEVHRSHFGFRARETRTRPRDNYLRHFSNIRKIQAYIRTLALTHGVPVIQSYDLDATLAQCLDLILTKVGESVKSPEPAPSVVQDAVNMREESIR